MRRTIECEQKAMREMPTSVFHNGSRSPGPFTIFCLVLVGFFLSVPHATGFQTEENGHRQARPPVAVAAADSVEAATAVQEPSSAGSAEPPAAFPDNERVFPSPAQARHRKQVGIRRHFGAESTGFMLVGTVVANVSSSSVAIFETRGRQKMYHEGDKAGDFVIREIRYDSVILASEEESGVLALTWSERATATAAARSSTPTRLPAPRTGKSVRFSSVELPREELLPVLDDIEQSVRDADVQSYRFVNLTGFRIGSVSNTPVLKKIGLRPYDAILAINGVVLRDKEDCLAFFQHLADNIAHGEKATILIRRRMRTSLIELDPI